MAGARDHKNTPRVTKYVHGGSYQVLGLPEVSPIFPNRPEAEKWLRAQLAEAGDLKRPRERTCLCCKHPFMSAHAGNRLCSGCRSHGDLGAMAIASTSAGKVRRAARS
jgi:hypothetical protein